MIPRCLSRILGSSFTQTVRRNHGVTKISETNAKEAFGKRTRVQGWVRAIRKMKNSVFLDINDGSSAQHLQVVLNKSEKPENLGYGCSVSIVGEIASAPNGRTEIRAEEIDILGGCDLNDGYPFLPRKQYDQEYIRQYLHLRPRTKNFSSILRLRDLASSAVGEHMRSRGFFHVHTPTLTSNDCEGAGEVFKVIPENAEMLKTMERENQDLESAYFNAKAYLTVSGQFHLETVARSLSKVYTFGPTFRAENSASRLHLSEFYMIEAEMAFLTDIENLIVESELLVKAMTHSLFNQGALDLETLGVSEPTWLNQKFLILTYDEAMQILEKNVDKLTVGIRKGESFSKEHELFLVDYCNQVPVFVINWPKQTKAFYMKECQDDSSKVAAMDLLVPIVGELIGGSLREDNYEILKQKIPATADVSWYLELRKWGNVPTGGYGMGFERYIQTVLGIPNIKDVIPFPRWPHNCSL